MNMSPVFKNYNDFATPSTNNRSAPYYVSDECIDDLLWEQIDRSTMLHCARLIRNVTRADIFLIWQPFYSDDLTKIGWRARQFQPILDNKDQAFIKARMTQVEERLLDEGFFVLNQPESTTSQGVMTKAELSRGSLLFRHDLKKSHREEDVFHMNNQFGQQCWKEWVL